MKTIIGAIYQDDYIRENNRWLIAKRLGNFAWQEKRKYFVEQLITSVIVREINF